MSAKIEIKTFDGNLEALRELLRSAWIYDYSKQKQSVIDFTLSYLKCNLYGPLSNEYFHIGAYDNDKLVGFAASFPRNYEYASTIAGTTTKGKVKGVMSTYFTTHQDYRRMGIGTMLAKERIRRHIEQGVEINLFFQDHGHSSSKVYPRFVGFMNSSYSTLTSIHFLVRILDMKRLCKMEYFSTFQEKFFSLFQFVMSSKTLISPSECVRTFQREDIDACLDIVNSLSFKNGLCRRWEKDELLWDLENELSSTLVYLKGEKVVALINYHVLDMIGRTSEKVVQVDNIFLDRLNFYERCHFVNHLIAMVKKDDAIMIMIPRFSYFKSSAFYWNRFMPYLRKQHLKVLNYSNEIQLDNCSTIYTYYR